MGGIRVSGSSAEDELIKEHDELIESIDEIDVVKTHAKLQSVIEDQINTPRSDHSSSSPEAIEENLEAITEETSSSSPEAIEENLEAVTEETCRHPKDVNCKMTPSNSMLDENEEAQEANEV